MTWTVRLPSLRPEEFGDQVDIILRPSQDAALRSVDCDRYWNSEIVQPDTAVRW